MQPVENNWVTWYIEIQPMSQVDFVAKLDKGILRFNSWSCPTPKHPPRRSETFGKQTNEILTSEAIPVIIMCWLLEGEVTIFLHYNQDILVFAMQQVEETALANIGPAMYRYDHFRLIRGSCYIWEIQVVFSIPVFGVKA